MKNRGQYDVEYKKCSCFWGFKPSKFGKIIPKYISSGKILDLGAGEGKNSFYLASKGFKVVAVEISLYAVRNFINEAIKKNNNKRANIKNINIICSDVTDWQIIDSFDCIIAYGLLHCLKSKREIDLLIQKMKKHTKKGGINVICTFTNDIKIPKSQKYLKPTFLSNNDLKNKYYKDWAIIKYEIDTIKHIHPTSKKIHKHSVCRMIAKKK